MVERVTSGMYGDADIWTIQGGVNDVGYSSPLGSLSPIGSNYDNTTIYGALQTMVEYILNSEHPRLILFTPNHNVVGSSTPNIVQVRQAILDVAELYSLPVCDLWLEGGINLYNARRDSNPTTTDGVHLTNLGAEYIAPLIARKLLESLLGA